MRQLRFVVLVIGFLLTACGGSDGTTTTEPATSTTVAGVTATSSAPVETTTTEPASITVPATISTISPPPSSTLVAPELTVPTEELPGEPVDIFPSAGTELSVLGVRHDDVLNVRSIPGSESDIIATLDPTASGFVATGRHQQLPTTWWMEVIIDSDTVGWINRTFAAIEGVTFDDTERVRGLLDSTTASALEDLGRRIAELGVDPDVLQRIEMSVAPVLGDPSEVVFDVVGLGDDSVAGQRVRVFAVTTEDQEWTLISVEVTAMCGRGGQVGGPCL
ncbi:MAG: hypothetical protein AAGA37_07145 [Actinomycetota bacterium]